MLLNPIRYCNHNDFWHSQLPLALKFTLVHHVVENSVNFISLLPITLQRFLPIGTHHSSKQSHFNNDKTLTFFAISSRRSRVHSERLFVTIIIRTMAPPTSRSFLSSSLLTFIVYFVLVIGVVITVVVIIVIVIVFIIIIIIIIIIIMFWILLPYILLQFTLLTGQSASKDLPISQASKNCHKFDFREASQPFNLSYCFTYVYDSSSCPIQRSNVLG